MLFKSGRELSQTLNELRDKRLLLKTSRCDIILFRGFTSIKKPLILKMFGIF